MTMTDPPVELSVLIPALNEEGNIGELVQRCHGVMITKS